MSKLAKDLGIELKPFCVLINSVPSKQMAQDILNRLVTLGAEPEESFEGTDAAGIYYTYECPWSFTNNFCYLGLSQGYETFLEDSLSHYHDNQLSYQEVLDYLQLVESRGRLVGKEALEPAEGEWIQWEGGDMPVEVGTMVEVKYRDGDMSTVTAGLRDHDEGFLRLKGKSFAVRWDHLRLGGDIVAYRIHKPVDSPEQAPDQSSPETKANLQGTGEEPSETPLERLIRLVIMVIENEVVYCDNGEGEAEEANAFSEMVLSLLDNVHMYGTEEEMMKVSLDNQIKSTQDSLNGLIEKRKSYD